MKKSVYSLVLMDEVVQAVDRMAYAVGTSRSNLINQILAEHLSCETPEKRMKEVFDSVTALMDELESFQVQMRQSDALLSIRSALRYKYKPTVRYQIELYRSKGDVAGELRVSLRSTSQPLLEAVEGFYRLWAALERRYLGPYLSIEHLCEIGTGGRFIRRFYYPRQHPGSEALAEAICGYIQQFDRLLKLYFSLLEHRPAAQAQVEEAYRQWLQSGAPII